MDGDPGFVRAWGPKGAASIGPNEDQALNELSRGFGAV